jgi:hypothetical protein
LNVSRVRRNVVGPVAFACALLSGCGGGGGAVPGGSSATLPPTQASISITILVPLATQSTQVRPRYISSRTQSGSLSVNGAQPIVANLTAGSPNCASSAQGLTCTVSASAQAGTATIAVQLFGQLNAQGPVLSRATTTTTITGGAANVVSLTLNGIVAKVVLVLANATPDQGTAAQIGLTATFYDAAGAAIVGDPFDNPVTLTDSDASGATSLSRTTLSSPADAVSLSVSYSGAVVGAITFGATANGLAAANVTPATLTSKPPQPPQQFVDWPTYGFDNHRDSFNPASTALSPSTLSQLHLAWHQLGYNGDFSTQTEPVLATNIGGHAGLLFVGGGSGFAYAFDALTGNEVWRRSLGVETFGCQGGGSFTIGIGGSAAYDPGSRTLYVPANVNSSVNGPATNSIVRLDAASGTVLGSVNVSPTLIGSELNVAHTALTLANGFVYTGTSSTCDISPWRGRVAAVNPTLSGAPHVFFTAYGQGGNYSGGGVWGWGGVSVDDSGAVFAGVGNTDDNTTATGPKPPFTQTNDETAGYGDHIIKLAADVSGVLDENNPGYTFGGNSSDLDFSGTPVLFTPLGCADPLAAAQGKAGELVVYDSQILNSGPIARFRTAPSTFDAGDIGNPAWSPVTGLLYVVVSSGSGGSIQPPGMFALKPSGCNGATTFSIAWHTNFGPDSYAGVNVEPRSAPTVTAGGVVLVGTACTSDGAGGCAPTIGAAFGGALWALDASTGALLNGGKPVLLTADHIRVPPVVDAKWVFVQDNGADLYGLTLDPNFKAIQNSSRATRGRAGWYQLHRQKR